MLEAPVHLAFWLDPWFNQLEDFREVCRRIRDRYPKVRPSVHSRKTHLRNLASIARMATRPTLSVELTRVRPPGPLRGNRLRPLWIPKDEEYRRLDAAGLPVPKWVKIEPGIKLDPAEWGPYVVVKPTLSLQGRHVIVQKTSRVRFRSAEELGEAHLGRYGMLAQVFVYSGIKPVSYRVATFLGEVIHARRAEAEQARPLASRYDFAATGGHNIVATAFGGRISLSDDADLLAMARRVAAAFPEVPVLGLDLVRDADDGKIYVIETNPGGTSFSLTDGQSRRMMRDFNLDFYAQFDALELMTRVSAEAALRLAR